MRSSDALLAFDVKAHGYVGVGKYDVASGRQNRSCWFSIEGAIIGPAIAAYVLPSGTYLVSEFGGTSDRYSYVVRLRRGDRKFVARHSGILHPETTQEAMPAPLREKGFENASDVTASSQDVLAIVCSF